MNLRDHRVEGAALRAANAFGGEMKPSLIVVHDTAGAPGQGQHGQLVLVKDCGTSAHVVVAWHGP